jgi:hypothetical protein
MLDIEDVLADAQREIKAIGDNVKSLKDTTDKSLADVRKLDEDVPKAVAGSDQFKKDVEALIAGVLEKHEAISARVKAPKLNRGKLGGGWGDTDEGTKAAKAFARDARAIKHELKADFDRGRRHQLRGDQIAGDLSRRAIAPLDIIIAEPASFGPGSTCNLESMSFSL